MRRGAQRRVKFSRFGQLSIFGTLIVMCILLLVGSNVPSFRMRTAGIAGKLLDLGRVSLGIGRRCRRGYACV